MENEALVEHKRTLFEAAKNGEPVMFEFLPGLFSRSELSQMPEGSHAVVNVSVMIEYLPDSFFSPD